MMQREARRGSALRNSRWQLRRNAVLINNQHMRTHAVRRSVVYCWMVCVVKMIVVQMGEFTIETNSCFMLMSIF